MNTYVEKNYNIFNVSASKTINYYYIDFSQGNNILITLL